MARSPLSGTLEGPFPFCVPPVSPTNPAAAPVADTVSSVGTVPVTFQITFLINLSMFFPFLSDAIFTDFAKIFAI